MNLVSKFQKYRMVVTCFIQISHINYNNYSRSGLMSLTKRVIFKSTTIGLDILTSGSAKFVFKFKTMKYSLYFLRFFLN